MVLFEEQYQDWVEYEEPISCTQYVLVHGELQQQETNNLTGPVVNQLKKYSTHS